MFKPSDTFRGEFSVYSDTDVLVAADATPTGVLVVDGVDGAAVVTITTPSTGVYKVSVPLTGLSEGAVCYIRVTAVINTLTQIETLQTFSITSKHLGDLNDFDTATDLVALQDIDGIPSEQILAWMHALLGGKTEKSGNDIIAKRLASDTILGTTTLTATTGVKTGVAGV